MMLLRALSKAILATSCLVLVQMAGGACSSDSGGSQGGAAGSGGSGGSSGSGGSGGSGMPSMANGCDSTMAIDKTADARTTILFAPNEYTPRCVRVKTGSIITFSGDFSAHPLVGGNVTNGVGTPDPDSPFALSSGAQLMVTINRAGTYPYYCSAHVAGGMMGAVFVE